MIIKTENNKGFKWISLGNIRYKGMINSSIDDLSTDEMILYSDMMDTNKASMQILEEINNLKDLESLKKSVNRINGEFVIIKEDEDIIFAAVDNIRSIPLFYKIKDNNLIISDMGYNLIDEDNINQKDEIANKEFKISGIVWSNRTLIKDIKALSAGEFIFFDKNTGDFIHDKYMRFKYRKGYDNSEEIAKDRIRKAYSIGVKDLIKFADNNTIMLPLSGGQDSRIVVHQLKEAGYDNVICYSYGKKGNAESELSRKIAEFLGYKWIFVSYDDIDWKQWYNSDEYEEFSKYSSNLISAPHFQDFHAVKFLKENNLIPENTIFAPGHSGDFIHGDHIPRAFLKTNKLDINYISKELIKEIGNNYWEDSKSLDILIPEIKRIISPKTNADNIDLIEYYEYFDWIERQSKAIANAVRVYEFFGYKWYMMLWNRIVFEAWSTIIPKLRYHRTLHYKIVVDDQRDLRKAINDNGIGNPDDGFRNDIKDIVRRNMPWLFKRLVFNRNNKNLINNYDNHHLNWNKIKSKEDFIKIATNCSNINGIVAVDMLNYFKNKFNWN